MFKGGQTKSLKEEFKARLKYKRGATYDIRDRVIDTWYQYPNYGFLNSEFEVVLPNVGSNYENLTQFGEYADPSQRALPFATAGS